MSKKNNPWILGYENKVDKAEYRTNTRSSAFISGDHRYTLERRVEDEHGWSERGPSLLWLMLNPSTADYNDDDPTIRKVLGFTRRAGGSVVMVANLFSYRATDPKVCKANLEIAEGELNMALILEGAKLAEKVVCAWGATPWARPQAIKVMEMLACYLDDLDQKLVCLGLTKDGSPKHPLMPSYEHKLQPFERMKYLGDSYCPIARS